MEWTIGMEHWTELFSLFGQVSVSCLERSLHFKLTSSWPLWMIVIMAIVVHCIELKLCYIGIE